MAQNQKQEAEEGGPDGKTPENTEGYTTRAYHGCLLATHVVAQTPWPETITAQKGVPAEKAEWQGLGKSGHGEDGSTGVWIVTSHSPPALLSPRYLVQTCFLVSALHL